MTFNLLKRGSSPLSTQMSFSESNAAFINSHMVLAFLIFRAHFAQTREDFFVA